MVILKIAITTTFHCKFIVKPAKSQFVEIAVFLDLITIKFNGFIRTYNKYDF